MSSISTWKRPSLTVTPEKLAVSQALPPLAAVVVAVAAAGLFVALRGGRIAAAPAARAAN